MNPYWRLMRLDKPIGIYLLLYPTLWALFLAQDGLPQLDLLFIFVFGTVLMRSAGCVINDYADRKIDGLVGRTEKRPIATGEISANNALKLFIMLMCAAFMLVLLTNWLTIGLALIAGALATLYPFTKRWTHLPQFVLGLAFSMSVPMAFAATKGVVPISAWWVFGATVVWVMIYDTMYAMADREEDLKIGVKSSAILFAKYDKLIIGLLQTLLLFMLIKISIVFDLGIFYHIALVLSLFLMIYHQKLIKNREKDACFQAFLNNHYIGLIILCGIAITLIV